MTPSKMQTLRKLSKEHNKYITIKEGDSNILLLFLVYSIQRMKKENILKQIVLQEYGEKKHPKLTKNQFSLSSELYFEVERIYKELGERWKNLH